MKDELLALKLRNINLNLFRVFAARYKKLNLDITPIQGRIIMFIYESKKDICQRDIEHSIYCKKSTISVILKTMEKNNLITRVGSMTDSRCNIIKLTKSSLDIAKILQEDMKKINKILGENITKNEYIIFSDVLKKINDNLERI